MAGATNREAWRAAAASAAGRSPTPHPTAPALCRCEGTAHLKPLAGEAGEEWCRGQAERAVYAGEHDARSMQSPLAPLAMTDHVQQAPPQAHQRSHHSNPDCWERGPGRWCPLQDRCGLGAFLAGSARSRNPADATKSVTIAPVRSACATAPLQLPPPLPPPPPAVLSNCKICCTSAASQALHLRHPVKHPLVKVTGWMVCLILHAWLPRAPLAHRQPRALLHSRCGGLPWLRPGLHTHRILPLAHLHACRIPSGLPALRLWVARCSCLQNA